MGDSDPKSNNPLSPYYPSDPPDIPGNGSRWFAILFILLLLASAVLAAVSYLL